MVTRGGPPVDLPPALTQVTGEAPAPTTHCLAGSFWKPSAPVTLMLSVTAMGGGGRAGTGWGPAALLHALPDPFLRQTCCGPSVLPGAASSRGFLLAGVASAYHDHLFVPSGSETRPRPGGTAPPRTPLESCSSMSGGSGTQVLPHEPGSGFLARPCKTRFPRLSCTGPVSADTWRAGCCLSPRGPGRWAGLGVGEGRGIENFLQGEEL